jgi:hypothetical protein
LAFPGQSCFGLSLDPEAIVHLRNLETLQEITWKLKAARGGPD